MSSKEITTLRKEGKLEEALQLANQALEAEPENIWNKRAAAWVYYEYLKKYAQPDSFELFQENLNKLNDLKLPENENMVFDQSAWQIFKMVNSLQKIEPIDFKKINTIFKTIKEFHFTKPSQAFTKVYQAFHKGHKNWSNYLEFADWWNFENFLPEDFISEKVGKVTYTPIAEQAYLAYSKKLSSDKESAAFHLSKNENTEKINNFLPQLEKIIKEYPQFTYLPYFKAKLLLGIGNTKELPSEFIHFAKQKRNDFWVWNLMADFFSDDKDLQFSCYCKALSTNAPNTYLVKVRKIFADRLIQKELFNEAKTEINNIIETRNSQKWKIPPVISDWTKQAWYKTAETFKNNKALYSKYLNKAEEILFNHIPEELIAVEFVNKNKGMLNFVIDENKYGYFNYSRHIDNPKIGDLLSVRFNGPIKNGSCKIITLKKVEGALPIPAIKDFSGPIKLVDPLKFGFVNNNYVDLNLIKSKDIKKGQIITGKAILSFNKKKNEWGWKAFEVN